MMLQTIDRGIGKKISTFDSSLTSIIEIAAEMMPNANKPAKTLSPPSHPQLIQATIPEIMPRIEKTKRIKIDLSMGFVVYSSFGLIGMLKGWRVFPLVCAVRMAWAPR